MIVALATWRIESNLWRAISLPSTFSQNNEACFLAAIGIATGFIQVEQDFLVEAEGAGVRRKCDVGTRLRLEAIDDPACFSGEFFMLITHHRGAMQENVGDGIDPTEGIVGRLAGAAARARNDLFHLDLGDAEHAVDKLGFFDALLGQADSTLE